MIKKAVLSIVLICAMLISFPLAFVHAEEGATTAGSGAPAGAEDPAITAFKEKYKHLFELTEETVTPEAKDEILEALEALVQIQVDDSGKKEAPGVHLTALKTKIEKLEAEFKQVLAFNETYKSILIDKKPENAEIKDKDLVKKALAEITDLEQKLSPQSREKVAALKTLLQKYETKIQELEKEAGDATAPVSAEEEAKEFRNKNQAIIDKKDVNISDEEDVNKVIALYESLKPEVKEKLNAEKEKLDALKRKIGYLNQAAKYKTDYAEVDNPDFNKDETKLKEAIEAFNQLPKEVKLLLTNQEGRLKTLREELTKAGKQIPEIVDAASTNPTEIKKEHPQNPAGKKDKKENGKNPEAKDKPKAPIFKQPKKTHGLSFKRPVYGLEYKAKTGKDQVPSTAAATTGSATGAVALLLTLGSALVIKNKRR